MDEKRNVSRLFLIIAVLFVVCLVLSNLIAGKMWKITDSIALPAAVILFPVTYILGDVFTEVYGFKRARMVIWTGFFCSFFAVLVYLITILLPPPVFFENQEAYQIVLGTTPRVAAASFLGYLFGEFSNSFVLSRLKVKTEGRHLWLRTIGSTIIGEALDSVIFITVSFAGTMETKTLLFMILFQYLFKVTYEVLCTPLTYYVIKKLKQKEQTDVYDRDVHYRVIGRM